jgi:hypothetical protein
VVEEVDTVGALFADGDGGGVKWVGWGCSGGEGLGKVSLGAELVEMLGVLEWS